MSDEKKKWSEIVLEAKDDGRVVFFCIDEVLTAPVKEIIKQPADGLLWDLNRDEVTALSWMNKDGMLHWVNNFAVALVIRELKSQLEQLEEDYTMLQKGLCGTNAELSNAWATAEKAEDKIEKLKAENKKLRNHAVHRIGCESWNGKPCDCGLDTLLKGKGK